MSIFEHLKTGNLYEVLTPAINATNACDNQDVFIYQRFGQPTARCVLINDMVFVREKAEFQEKFKPVIVRLGCACDLDTWLAADPTHQRACPSDRLCTIATLLRMRNAAVNSVTACTCRAESENETVGHVERRLDDIATEIYRGTVKQNCRDLVFVSDCKGAVECALGVISELVALYPKSFR
jgi:hypothetical protein